jgi:hypothetical protein
LETNKQFSTVTEKGGKSVVGLELNSIDRRMTDVNNKVEDAWNYMKDRFSNPFFYSFVISWLVVNWEITIAFIFYDSEMLLREGFLSYKDYVVAQGKTASDLYWCPIMYASLYTVFAPLSKQGLILFNSLVFARGNKMNLSILGKGKISIDKYISLQKSIEEKEGILEDRIASESDNYTRLQEALNEKTKIEAELEKSQKSVNILTKGTENVTSEREKLIAKFNELQQKYKLATGQVKVFEKGYEDDKKTKSELDKLVRELNGEEAMKMLQGRWTSQFHNPSNGKSGGEEILIEGSDFSARRGKSFVLVAKIARASYNSYTGNISFTKVLSEKHAFDSTFSQRGKCLFNNLKVVNHGEILNGFEDEFLTITYTRFKSETSVS